jgi:flagellin-like hook-associated protein FlgL
MFVRFALRGAVVAAALVISFGVLAAENSSLIFLNRILSGNELNYDKNIKRIAGGRLLLSDDPANYAVYETLEKHIRAFRKDIENKADLISYYNYQEAVTGDITDILQRVRELALKRFDPFFSDSERDIIDREIGQDYDQIVLELRQSEFNGKHIFEDLFEDGAVKSLFRDKDHFSPDNVEKLIDYFIYQRTYTGAEINRLSYEIYGEKIAEENMTRSQSQNDTDIAREMSLLTLNHLKMLVNLLMLHEAEN